MKTEKELEKLELKTETALDQCSVSQLKDLLRLGMDRGAKPTSLPAEAGNMAALVQLLEGLLPKEEKSGRVLLDTVSESGSKLAVLRQIKNVAKRVVKKARTDRHRNAGRILYHAAIAAAYGRYGENISTLPIRPRLPLYEDLASVLVGKRLGAVFRRAVERAREDEMGTGRSEKAGGSGGGRQ